MRFALCDGSTTTWNATAESLKGASQNWLLNFTCGNCKAKTERSIWYRYFCTTDHSGIDTATIAFVAQWPKWAPTISNSLQRLLGSRVELLRRAIYCQRIGFGIAACAYLRRLIEEETNDLLDMIETAAKEEGDEKMLANLAEARKQQRAEDRLSLAKTTVPKSLTRGGHNPLAKLYGVLSGELHAGSDAEAQKLASEIMATVMFVFETLKEDQRRSAEYLKTIGGLGNDKEAPVGEGEVPDSDEVDASEEEDAPA
jgi:hypothetical protein